LGSNVESKEFDVVRQPLKIDMPSHEITALHAWILREPVSLRAYTVVQLTTASGLQGYGECGEVATLEIEAARRIVIGRLATAGEAVGLALRGVSHASAAIEIAMLDIVGKVAKAPVYQILGGPTRYRVRALVPLHGDTDTALASSAKTLRAHGFRAFMVPIPSPAARNQGLAFTQAVKHRLEAVRAAVDDGDFVVDGGAALTPGDARTLSAPLEPFHLLWFDEPCPMSSPPEIRKIADESVTPLGFGRYIERPAEVQDALREEILDILRLDLARHGITPIRKMAALAETYYIAVAPYHNGGPIGTAAALHLAASLPNFFIQQIPNAVGDADVRMRAELAGGSIEEAKDGFFPLPTGPGLGINVSREALEKYKERTI
jgi:galactonate dehydratase